MSTRQTTSVSPFKRIILAAVRRVDHIEEVVVNDRRSKTHIEMITITQMREAIG